MCRTSRRTDEQAPLTSPAKQVACHVIRSTICHRYPVAAAAGVQFQPKAEPVTTVGGPDKHGGTHLHG